MFLILDVPLRDKTLDFVPRCPARVFVSAVVASGAVPPFQNSWIHPCGAVFSGTSSFPQSFS